MTGMKHKVKKWSMCRSKKREAEVKLRNEVKIIPYRNMIDRITKVTD